jgi:uncharacterized protein (DUF1800 family)
MPDQTRSDIALLYRRAGFGLPAEELDARAAAGYEAAVEDLLAGLGDAPDTAGDQVEVPAFAPFPHGPPAGAARKEVDRARQAELAALQAWWLDRMIVTSTPLREKLTLFWHGHFATGVSKVRDPKLMYLQNELFRSAGAGDFEVLTQEIAKDGAMMIWLDIATDKKADPNENFAREMMELFTLGLGNYTQADVTAAARAFTGWTYDRADYRYVFRRRQHDFGLKTYLGHTGYWNGDDIVHIAVHEAVSARFILAALWSHFAYPVAATDPVVGDLIGSYGASLDVKSALRAVFLHPAFLSATCRLGLVKQPIEYLVGAARSLGLNARLEPLAAVAGSPTMSEGAGTTTLAALAANLGQEPFNPPNVGGWGQNDYWLDTATTQLRLDAAVALARRADLTAVEGASTSGRLAAVAALLGVEGWGPTTTNALAPEVGEPVRLVALAMTAPEYVLA